MCVCVREREKSDKKKTLSGFYGRPASCLFSQQEEEEVNQNTHMGQSLHVLDLVLVCSYAGL